MWVSNQARKLTSSDLVGSAGSYYLCVCVCLCVYSQVLCRANNGKMAQHVKSVVTQEVLWNRK